MLIKNISKIFFNLGDFQVGGGRDGENCLDGGYFLGIETIKHWWCIVRQPLYTSFWGIKFFFMDSVSLGIADDQTESWNFVSVEQFKI